jgi:hypothetical protein
MKGEVISQRIIILILVYSFKGLEKESLEMFL